MRLPLQAFPTGSGLSVQAGCREPGRQSAPLRYERAELTQKKAAQRAGLKGVCEVSSSLCEELNNGYIARNGRLSN